MTKRVNAPVEIVWEKATDIANCAQWLSGVDQIDVIQGGAEFGVGTRWDETRTLMGRQGTEQMYVTAMTPLRSYTVEADSDGVHYVSIFDFKPLADGTMIRFTFGAEGGGLLAKLMGPIGNLIVSRQLKQDLADLTEAAERAARQRG